MKNENISIKDDIAADPMEALALAAKTADTKVREASTTKLIEVIRYDLITTSRKQFPSFRAEELADIAIGQRFCKLMDAYDPEIGAFKNLYMRQRKAWLLDAIKEIEYGGSTISDDDLKSFKTAQKYKNRHISDTIDDMINDIKSCTDDDCSDLMGLKKLRARSPEYIRKMLLAEDLKDIALQYSPIDADPLSETTSMLILDSLSGNSYCESFDEVFALRDAILEIVNACGLNEVEAFILNTMVTDLTREAIQAGLREKYSMIKSFSWITQQQQKLQRKIAKEFTRQDIHDLTT